MKTKDNALLMLALNDSYSRAVRRLDEIELAHGMETRKQSRRSSKGIATRRTVAESAIPLSDEVAKEYNLLAGREFACLELSRVMGVNVATISHIAQIALAAIEAKEVAEKAAQEKMTAKKAA